MKHKQIEDPLLIYSVRVDNEDKMTNFFWVDGMSVVDYSYFDDVVCFDSTYQTNRYSRPFAPFVGVNQHRQTVLFSAGLLLNENIELFIWPFKTFLHTMSGQAPKTILTDQSAAMAKTISLVIPQTQHRLC